MVASGGRWLRLGPFGHSDDTEARRIATARGAEATYADFGRYFYDPVYQQRAGEISRVMQEAVELYRKGTVRPHISATVAFEDGAVQQAMMDSGSGKLSIGKAVVKIGTGS